MSSFRAQILTLFPEMFPGPLGFSLPGRALADGVWSCKTFNIRDYATDKHKTVDDTPYGGGAGMVMRPDIIDQAIKAAAADDGEAAFKIYLSPRGRVFDQRLAEQILSAGSVLLLCGRYEGVDQRVIERHNLAEVSLGDFVLAGGEVAAMTVLESVIRLIPGVMGNAATVSEESFVNSLLEYPHYTRPPEWEGLKVPEVLLSGHHENVKIWRKQQSEALTCQSRPDLWQKYEINRKKLSKKIETTDK